MTALIKAKTETKPIAREVQIPTKVMVLLIQTEPKRLFKQPSLVCPDAPDADRDIELSEEDGMGVMKRSWNGNKMGGCRFFSFMGNEKNITWESWIKEKEQNYFEFERNNTSVLIQRY